MGHIKDFIELPKDTRSILMLFFGILPFWLLDIILFLPYFLKSNPVYYSLILGICLSIIYFYLTYGASIITYRLASVGKIKKVEVNPNPRLEQIQSDNETYYLTFYIGTILICIYTYLGYRFHWGFMQFLNWIFGTLILYKVFLFYLGIKKFSALIKENKKG